MTFLEKSNIFTSFFPFSFVFQKINATSWYCYSAFSSAAILTVNLLAVSKNLPK